MYVENKQKRTDETSDGCDKRNALYTSAGFPGIRITLKSSGTLQK